MGRINVLFDVDDTLYSRMMPFERAWSESFGPLPSGLEQKLYDDFIRYGYDLYEDSMTGRVTMEEMFIYRIVKTGEGARLNLSDEQALAFQDRYEYWQGRLFVSDTMASLLDALTDRKCFLAVITNGTTARQWKKYHVLDLKRWIPETQYMATGDVGISKPDLRVFRLAAEKWGLRPEDTWYVGDSQSHDIQPALSLGWHAAWLRRNPTAFAPQDPAAPAPDVAADTEEELRDRLLAALDA